MFQLKGLVLILGVSALFWLSYLPLLRPSGHAPLTDWWRLLRQDIYFSDGFTVRHTRGTGYYASIVLPERCGGVEGFIGYARPTLSPDGKSLFVYKLSGRADASVSMLGRRKCSNEMYTAVEVLLIDLWSESQHVVLRRDSPVPFQETESWFSHRFLKSDWRHFVRWQAEIGSAAAPAVDPFSVSWSKDGATLSFNFDNNSYDYDLQRHTLLATGKLRELDASSSDSCFYPSTIHCPDNRCAVPEQTSEYCSFLIQDGRYSIFQLRREGLGAVAFVAARNNETGATFTVAPYNWAVYAE